MELFFKLKKINFIKFKLLVNFFIFELHSPYVLTLNFKEVKSIIQRF